MTHEHTNSVRDVSELSFDPQDFLDRLERALRAAQKRESEVLASAAAT